jgi:hypothetical protein
MRWLNRTRCALGCVGVFIGAGVAQASLPPLPAKMPLDDTLTSYETPSLPSTVQAAAGNPEMYSPEVHNPEVHNPEVHNPEVHNPFLLGESAEDQKALGGPDASGADAADDLRSRGRHVHRFRQRAQWHRATTSLRARSKVHPCRLLRHNVLAKPRLKPWTTVLSRTSPSRSISSMPN